MRAVTIAQKMSGTGTIHDLASDQCEIVLVFDTAESAVVTPAYYNTNPIYTDADGIKDAMAEMADYSPSIIDRDGCLCMYDDYNGVVGMRGPTGYEVSDDD